MTKTDAAVQTLSGINPDVVLEVRNYAQYQYLSVMPLPTSINQLFHQIQSTVSFWLKWQNLGCAVFELSMPNVVYFSLIYFVLQGGKLSLSYEVQNNMHFLGCIGWCNSTTIFLLFIRKPTSFSAAELLIEYYYSQRVWNIFGKPKSQELSWA